MLFLRYPEMKRSASCRILIQSSRRSISHLSVKRIDMNESDPRSNVHCLGSSENKAWKKKNSGPHGIWTHDLCDTGAVLYQLS